MEEFKDATPEQQKALSKILRKSFFRTFFIGLKSVVGLLIANGICVLACAKLLSDTDEAMQKGFLSVCMILNGIFMAIYLIGQHKKNYATIADQIKEVLKK
jgi:sensor domain CHASE-containing protein